MLIVMQKAIMSSPSLSERCEASIIASRAGPATNHRTGDRAGEAWRVRAEDNPQGAGPWEVLLFGSSAHTYRCAERLGVPSDEQTDEHHPL